MSIVSSLDVDGYTRTLISFSCTFRETCRFPRDSSASPVGRVQSAEHTVGIGKSECVVIHGFAPNSAQPCCNLRVCMYVCEAYHNGRYAPVQLPCSSGHRSFALFLLRTNLRFRDAGGGGVLSTCLRSLKSLSGVVQKRYRLFHCLLIVPVQKSFMPALRFYSLCRAPRSLSQIHSPRRTNRHDSQTSF